MKKKNIGILTYQNTTNYGAVFQEYALQKYINNNFCDAEVIDYTNSTLKYRYSINPLSSKSITEFIKKTINFRNNLILDKKFESFKKKYIKISNHKYDENNIIEADKVYTSFIAGSDQIWNLDLSGNDENYFMTFTDTKDKRNSYAASNGTGIISKNREKFFELMSMQNYISVREKATKDELEKEKFKCFLNIDPVFLLTKDEWLKLASDVNIKYKNTKKYIFVYEVSRTPNLRNFAVELAKKECMEIIFISTSSKNIKGARKINTASPNEFLDLINNASYVVTSSFHGFAMSIILNKKVFYDLPSSLNNENFGSRLENLSSIFGLENRNISSENFEINTDMNFTGITKKIEDNVHESYKYLRDIVMKNDGDINE